MATVGEYGIYGGKIEHFAGHSHFGDRDNWNILLNQEGEVKLEILGSLLAFGADTLILIEPGPPRRFTVPKHWKGLWFHFDMEPRIVTRPEWPAVGPGVYAVTPPPDDLAKLRRTVEELVYTLRRRRPGWCLLAYCLAQEVILRGNMAHHAAALGEHIELTAKMLENLAAPRRIGEIADRCAMSRSSFFSKFRSTFGTTPNKYRERQLMTQAQTLLENTDKSLKEISLELGIGTPGYLSTRFRKTFGVPPREYRKRHRAAASGK